MTEKDRQLAQARIDAALESLHALVPSLVEVLKALEGPITPVKVVKEVPVPAEAPPQVEVEQPGAALAAASSPVSALTSADRERLERFRRRTREEVEWEPGVCVVALGGKPAARAMLETLERVLSTPHAEV